MHSLRKLPLLIIALFCSLGTGFPGVARAGLVAYWPFNDTGSLGTDAAGGTVLTAIGATFTASGKTGGGLALNGSGQFLSGTVNSLPIGNSSYAQAAWIKPTVLGPQGIVGWGTYGATQQVNAFRLFDSGNGFRHYWLGQDLDTTNLAMNLINGSWHHVATTYDGTTRRIYLNGVQVAQDTPGANASPTIFVEDACFAVAGDDKRWGWADTVIDGQTVVVSSADVPRPVAVRYAQGNDPVGANLYNGDGLPASPFRTNDWNDSEH